MSSLERVAEFPTRAAAAALLWLSAETGLLACPVCFRFEESAVTDGVRLAVFVLISVTAVVLAGFIAFARRVAQRQRADP
jgi:hypothetical protein